MFPLLLLACSENELVSTKSAPEGDTAAAVEVVEDCVGGRGGGRGGGGGGAYAYRRY
jgi:hypothetical protein